MTRVTKLLLAVAVVGLTGCKDLDIETDGDRDEFRFGSPVHLWVTFKDEVVPASATVTWRSDRQGDLGSGADVTLSTLVAGKHELEVDVRHGDKRGKKRRTIRIVNDAPAVSILTPRQGQRIGVGKPLGLSGAASDTEDGVLPPEALSWSSSLEGALGVGPAREVTHLRPGTHELVLLARDRAGAESRAKVSVEVTNEPPAVTIHEPGAATRIKVGERLRLRGSALDPDHRVGPERVPGASLEWVSDRDGRLGVGEDLTVDALSGGAHRIELVATDEFGKAGRASVRVEVVNLPPTVAIRAPGDGRYFSAKDEVRLEAEASDPEAALDPDDIVWRSNRDGTLGRGAVVRTDRLSVGEHRVTCTVTDRHGASASAEVRVLITNEAPTARILAPTAGGVVHLADALTLDGRGVDAEDGALDGDRLVWTAVKVETGRSVELGKGERVTARAARVVETLGFGRVEVRLTATDRDGAAGPTVAVTLTVENRAPEVRIGNPTDGATVAVGAPLLCSGYGNDPDRARLLENAEVVWTARRLEDGSTRELGRATRVEVRDLVAGTWELTLTGLDPDDAALRAQARVRVRVVEAPTTTTATTTTTTVAPDSTTTATTPTTGLTGAIPGS